MATPYQVNVQPAAPGIIPFSHDETTAAKVSDLVQQDLEGHHLTFSTVGYHNHIPHQLLTLYATGADADTLQRAFDFNASHQFPAKEPRQEVVDDLGRDYAAAAPRYLGKDEHYPDFLRYFQAEIDRKGWQPVVAEYLFRGDGDPTAHDLFARAFSSVLHALIQLMFGMEWNQPAIVAEALAQAAVHADDLADFFNQADSRAAAAAPSPRRTLPAILEDVAANPRYEKLRRSVRWGSDNYISDALNTNFDDLVDVASTMVVEPDKLEERTVEMAHTAAYVCASAAWNPPHESRYDFFLIHHLTVTPVFRMINDQAWIPHSTKVRLLEWKMRFDLVQFLARGSPRLDVGILRTYRPRARPPHGGDELAPGGGRDLLPRFHAINEDGHIIKTVRALLFVEEESAPYAGRDWVRIRSPREWTAAHHMLLDATEGQEMQWVRGAGFPEAWNDVPKMKIKSKL